MNTNIEELINAADTSKLLCSYCNKYYNRKDFILYMNGKFYDPSICITCWNKKWNIYQTTKK